jgi:hypothetical protein
MSRIGFAAIVLGCIACGRAEAEPFDMGDLYRKAEVLVRSLLAAPPSDHEVIKPPGNVDPKMALVPPSDGTMRLIEPSRRPRQQ